MSRKPVIGTYSQGKLPINSIDEVKVLILGNPLGFHIDDKVYLLSIDARDSDFYSYTLTQIKPEIKDLSSPPSTFYSLSKELKGKDSDEIMNFLIQNEDGTIPTSAEEVDLESLIYKLDTHFKLMIWNHLPPYASHRGVSPEQAENIFQLRKFLARYRIYLSSYTKLIQEAALGRKSLYCEINKDEDYDDYRFFSDYEMDSEIYISDELFEEFPDIDEDDWIYEFYEKLITAGFTDMTIQVV